MTEPKHIMISWYLLIYIIPTLIGGFLAGFAGWFVACHDIKRKKKWFQYAVKDDLEKSLLLYQQIMDDWARSSAVWFVTINELLASRKLCLQHADYLLSFPKKLRKRINNYYLRSSNAIETLNVQQLQKYNLDEQYWKSFTEVKNNNEGMPDTEIRKSVLANKMFRESMQWDWLCAALPNGVSGLIQFKIEAQAILDII